MSISENDAQVLGSLAKAREQHEELAELLSFYYDLYEVQYEAKADLPTPEVRDQVAMNWRLQGGIPQLSFDQLELEAEPFARLVDLIAVVLLRHNPGWELEREEGRPEDLLVLARQVFETWDTLTSPRPAEDEAAGDSDAAPETPHPWFLAVGFGLAPYLQLAADAIGPELDQTLWTEGYCPICGGRPNFAVLEDPSGLRHLVCSRCNFLWVHQRLGCPFCGSENKQTYYPSEDGIYRLYVCPDCNRYLKTMDLRGLFRPAHPVVERLLTVGMDLTAQQEGYGT